MGATKEPGSPQTVQPPKQTTPSPTSSPFFLNRPSSLMSKTRSPFLSYLSKNSSPPKTPTTPSPPSPAKSAGRDMNVKQLTLSGTSRKTQDANQSSPEPSSPQSSPQTSPQTTPPAVPPPPPPLTYSSRVLEQGSTRQPSAINDANDFAQTPSFSRAGARVTLDSEGKVIYSSNSLGRHRDGYTMASGSAGLLGKCMTLPASMHPAPGSNQHAYVRLDPSGKVETYTSSTIPRNTILRIRCADVSRYEASTFEVQGWNVHAEQSSKQHIHTECKAPVSIVGKEHAPACYVGAHSWHHVWQEHTSSCCVRISKQSVIRENDSSSTTRIHFYSIFQQAIRYKHSYL
ncbi:hypothetical protein HPB50_001815 [Hyalomma asiaticum]|uniref:Uncharacterized protein n=1 Tax=Hyalomma asiaticum TaxID=266040 RepID=A0ACB7RXA9_HYAAI|nr:hypothetical protein HPB50_001815 [Hyalomma asiaticum]